MSTDPHPTVYVYGEIIGELGAQFYLRYIATGDDHGEATRLAMKAWSGQRVQRLESFDGEPTRWTPAAAPYFASGIRKDPA